MPDSAAPPIPRQRINGSRPERDDLWKLVDDTKAGSMEAFGQLYVHTEKQVRQYLVRQVGDRDLADDLTSATYEKVLRKIQGVSRGATSPVAFLYRVAQNLARDHFRRKENRDTILVDEFTDWHIPPTPADEVHTSVWDGQEAVVLWDIVKRLSPLQRDVMVLRFRVGFNTVETAAVMQLSPVAARALQMRAVRSMAGDARVRELAAARR